jgi:mannose-6-phosphate isomerase-like protein (cupin superfamily)
MDAKVMTRDDLPWSEIAHELIGADHGARVCIIFVDAPPGGGPGLHKHPYEEVFISLEGTATFTVGDEQLRAGPGDVIIVPADTPHAFTNTGDGQLRQIDIHVNPTFSTEWL